MYTVLARQHRGNTETVATNDAGEALRCFCGFKEKLFYVIAHDDEGRDLSVTDLVRIVADEAWQSGALTGRVSSDGTTSCTVVPAA